MCVVWPVQRFAAEPIDRQLEIIQKMDELLALARKIDEALGQPDCSRQEKQDYLREIRDILKANQTKP